MPRRGASIVLAGAVLVLVLLTVACARGDAGGTNGPLGAQSMSSPAPALAGEGLDGTHVALGDLRGKVVVVNFWATWCTPCREEQPELVQLAHEYRDRDVEFLGVDERDDPAKARAWVKEFDVPYPSIVDEPGAWADDFALFGLPDTYVIDRSGTIRWAVYGQTDSAQLTQLIDRVLALSP